MKWIYLSSPQKSYIIWNKSAIFTSNHHLQGAWNHEIIEFRDTTRCSLNPRKSKESLNYLPLLPQTRFSSSRKSPCSQRATMFREKRDETTLRWNETSDREEVRQRGERRNDAEMKWDEWEGGGATERWERFGRWVPERREKREVFREEQRPHQKKGGATERWERDLGDEFQRGERI